MTTTLERPSTPIAQRLRTVLIIDDCDADRERLSHVLRTLYGADLDIRQADEGRQGLQLIERLPVDLVLLDYRLPDLSGLEMLIQIAEMTDHPAVILMTGQGNERLAAEAVKLGAVDYLVKSEANPQVLERMVTQVLRTSRLERRNAHIVQQMQRSHLDLDHFVKALSHDMNVNLMLLEHSVRDLKKSVGQSPLNNITEGFANVEASLRESRRFLDDLAKLSQSGKMDMQPQRLDPNTLIQEVLFEQKSLLRERNIAVEVEKNLPMLWCNENRIKQVFTNLIRNAARHGCDEKQPQISISTTQAADGLPAVDRVGFAIFDNGRGIPAEWRDDVFLPGRRVPGTRSSGTGMGLAIVKRIIEHYAGTITIDPTCQPGTRFLFTLPLADRA